MKIKVVITGDQGAGKTVLANKIAEMLKNEGKTFYIDNTPLPGGRGFQTEKQRQIDHAEYVIVDRE